MLACTAPAPSAPPATPVAEPDRQALLALIDRLPQARVAVVGDCCLDAYWELGPGAAETSLETGLPVRRVDRQRYGLGAAANVAANARAAGAGAVELVGVVGDDAFGAHLRRLAGEAGLDAAGLLAAEGWQTMVYAKPLDAQGAEQPRLDFGAGNRLDDGLRARLVAAVRAAAGRCAAVVVNQQVGAVLADPALAAALAAVAAEHPRTVFVVDARRAEAAVRGAWLKLNAAEAARLLDRPLPADGDGVAALARELAARRGAGVVVTRGERGLALCDGPTAWLVPGVLAGGAVDPVGAGDTVVALFAAALAAGADPLAAAWLAGFAASVTVRKLGTTGTAAPDELRAAVAGGDLLHRPELAEDPARARFLPGGQVEVVRAAAPRRITHAIFDHDGTISTLRQGWEAVMEPMMLQAVLGTRAGDAALRRRARAAVRELIERTTGIQTLAQMQELIALVRAFGCVPAAEVLDCHGYKRIYNDALLAFIRSRRQRLERGELAADDFIIRGALPFLSRLRAAGVQVHLASGTDQADVREEAAALGYAHLFAGIHGATGSLASEAKREVMDRIVRGSGADPGSLLVVGDGPVEMREGRRRGALCLGLASDEPRRWGVDAAKRARLIRAGADLVAGDFLAADLILPFCGIA